MEQVASGVALLDDRGEARRDGVEHRFRDRERWQEADRCGESRLFVVMGDMKLVVVSNRRWELLV